MRIWLPNSLNLGAESLSLGTLTSLGTSSITGTTENIIGCWDKAQSFERRQRAGVGSEDKAHLPHKPLPQDWERRYRANNDSAK